MAGRRHFDAAAGLRTAAIVAFAAGVGVWGAVLLAPQPSELPPALSAGAAPRTDTRPLAQWFGGPAAGIRVTVLGLISGLRGAAILSVDQGPAQAYVVGQALAAGVTLQAIEADGIVLDQDGAALSVPATQAPMPVAGFVRVPAAAAMP